MELATITADTTVIPNTSEPRTAPYKVDVRRGTVDSTLSAQWATRPMDERFLSIEDLYQHTVMRANSAKTEILETKHMKVNGDGGAIEIFAPDGRKLDPTHWSFGQICQRVGAPAGYLRELPAMLTAINLQFGLANNPTEMIKVYETDQTHGPGRELRAVTGPDYGRIYDHSLVSAVHKIAKNTQFKIPGQLNWSNGTYDPHHPVTLESTTLYASDRDVFLFLCDDLNPIEVGKLKNGDPDLMFRGFYCWNSETGSKALGISTFLLRGVCMNRNLWGVEQKQTLTIRHTKNAERSFLDTAMPVLDRLSTQDPMPIVTACRKAQALTLARDEEDRMKVLNGLDFSRRKAAEIIEQAVQTDGKPPETAWDFVQAITANSRNIPHIDERTKQESLSQKLMDKVLH